VDKFCLMSSVIGLAQSIWTWMTTMISKPIESIYNLNLKIKINNH